MDDDGDDNDDDEVFDSGNDSSTLSASVAAPVKSKRRSQSLNALGIDMPSELQTAEAEALVSHCGSMLLMFSDCIILHLIRQFTLDFLILIEAN